eukprot:4433404-Amphidinium_carterae.1
MQTQHTCDAKPGKFAGHGSAEQRARADDGLNCWYTTVTHYLTPYACHARPGYQKLTDAMCHRNHAR